MTFFVDTYPDRVYIVEKAIYPIGVSAMDLGDGGSGPKFH